jgi:hypothetical protein
MRSMAGVLEEALEQRHPVLLETEPELELASLAVVGAPTLVLQGDRDDVTWSTGPPSRPRCRTGGSRCSQAPTPCPWRIRPW